MGRKGWAALSTALGFVQEQQSTGCELWDQRSSQRVRSLRGKGPREDFIWSEHRDSFASRAYKAGIERCGIDCCRDKRSHWCFPLWSYPSTALVSPGSAEKKGGWVTYKLLLLRFEAALQGQERVTFAQSNFGPGLLCVEVADVRLSSAEAAARRTNPLACCHKHFSGIAVGVVWKLPWVRLFRPGSSPACSGAGHFAHCP